MSIASTAVATTTTTTRAPPIAAAATAPTAAPAAAPAPPSLRVDKHLRNTLATALRRTGPGALSGGGGGGGEGSGGGQPAPISPQQLVPVPPAADIRNMGTLPRIFKGERDKADAFMNELLRYLLLNADVPGFNLPIHQVTLTLTLIKGS
jgi:hypothetical protein